MPKSRRWLLASSFKRYHCSSALERTHMSDIRAAALLARSYGLDWLPCGHPADYLSTDADAYSAITYLDRDSVARLD